VDVTQASSFDFDRIVPELVSIARAAGEIILDVRKAGFEIRSKADKSPVTIADERAEAFILERLATLAPEIPAVGEEAYAAGARPDLGGGVFWLVDALDGTREFSNGGADFTVNIGLVADGVPVAGVVGAPALGAIYVGSPAGAFRTSGGTALAPIMARMSDPAGLVAVISKSHQSTEEDFLARYPIKQIVNRGSSLKFALIAAGEADIYPRLGPTSEWDIAAGHAVLAAAGGTVTTLDGGPLVYGKADIRNPHFVARGKLS
jgi:3'(2'), 5'-bisphosphate nucleotidase